MESTLEDDERLVQMVQDFIESDSSSLAIPTPYAAASDQHSYRYLALREILEEEETGAVEVLETVMKHMRRRRRTMMKEKGSGSGSCCRDHHNGSSTGLRNWLVHGLQMEGYPASLCNTSWVTSSCCPGGDYEYFDVLIRDDSSDMQRGRYHRLIVDIDFKSQFEVARPTRMYKDLTDILPMVFVGSEWKLNRVISILCSAAKQSLRESGLHIPPWRTAAYMQSKWLSRRITSSPEMNLQGSVDHGREIKNKMMIKSKRKDPRKHGSALSSEFSNMSINCC
ncbi:hypothetical protein SAY87_005876 [Trapa incisa]|uniref:Uncharacterized protein n=1 Tax=Trapa incisa TaxID=236973 RepID=A0AAN7Q7U2_9MYRT|nr:hypothetical protein SAY87_005876 [Trapa incisa]